MADAPRVFLSYSHDSDEHADRVLALADALCDRGIDVIRFFRFKVRGLGFLSVLS